MCDPSVCKQHFLHTLNKGPFLMVFLNTLSSFNFLNRKHLGKHDIINASAKSLQSCPTLCNPMNYSSPASSVHGILQARILEWVTMLSSRNLPDPGIKPVSLAPAALAGRFFTTNSTWEAHVICYHLYILNRKYI